MFYKWKNTQLSFKNKDILILGGSSGLGLALANLLKLKDANITISGRTLSKLLPFKNKFSIKVLDINKEFITEKTEYDYIFCCVGQSIPKFFKNSTDIEIKKMFDQNLFGPINALRQLIKYNKPNFTYVVIASSLALFTLPGYSFYSGSKIALSQIFKAFAMETKRIKIKIYYTSTIFSEGFDQENVTKPRITYEFEQSSFDKGCIPIERAKTLLDNMGYRNSISSDFITYLQMINVECEKFIDYLFLPLAVIFNVFLKVYIRYYFRKLDE